MCIEISAIASSIRAQTKVVVCWLSMIGIILAFCAVAQGQKTYDTLPYADQYNIKQLDGSETEAESEAIKKENKDKNDAIKEARKEIANALKLGNMGSISSKLNEFLNGYEFPAMTQTDAQSLSELGRLRAAFEKYYLNSRYPVSVREAVISQFVIPELKKIIDGENFHPAVRLNAIVMIGMLNDNEGNSRENPVPTAAVYPILKSVLNDPKYPAFLKVGALAGIQRHIEISTRTKSGQVPSGELESMSSYCVSVLNGKAADQEKWQDDLNYWMKRRAAQILGGIGEADGEAIQTLQTVLKTPSDPNGDDNFWLRFDALQAFSFLNSDRIEKQRVSDLMDMVTRFTSDSLGSEADYLQGSVEDLVLKNILFADNDLEKSGNAGLGKKKQGTRRGAGVGGLEGGGGPPPPGSGRGGDKGGEGQSAGKIEKPSVELPNYQLNASRERIKTVLYTARNVLTRNRGEEGLKKLGTKDENDQMDKIISEIDKLMDASDVGLVDLSRLDETAEPDEKNITKRLIEAYRTGATDLSALILKKDAPEEAAEELGGAGAAPAETPADDAGPGK